MNTQTTPDYSKLALLLAVPYMSPEMQMLIRIEAKMDLMFDAIRERLDRLDPLH